MSVGLWTCRRIKLREQLLFANENDFKEEAIVLCSRTNRQHAIVAAT